MNKIYIKIDDNFSLQNTFLEDLSNKNDTEIEISFISDFKSAKILRNFISDLSDTLNIDPIWKSRLILIADELNNNAIEYGSKPGEINIFKTIIKFTPDTFKFFLEVGDTGNGKGHKTAKDMILLRTTKKLKGFHKNNGIRGRGLFMIIEKLVDRLYFKDNDRGGLIVGIEKEFKIN